MANSWFRWWNGTTCDPKWVLIARKSGQKRALVLAVWSALLEHASETDGNVAEFDTETYAAWLDEETEAVQAVIDALTEKGMIENGCVTNWRKRQPLREDPSTERVRAFREREAKKKRGETEGGNSVTPCNAHETQRNAPDSDTDSDTDSDSPPPFPQIEKSRVTETVPPRPPETVQTTAKGGGNVNMPQNQEKIWLVRCQTEFQNTLFATALDFHVVTVLLRRGADLDLDVIPAIHRALAENTDPDPPRKWKFFERWIERQWQNRVNPQPAKPSFQKKQPVDLHAVEALMTQMKSDPDAYGYSPATLQ